MIQKIIIAAGGTGGHIYPGIVIAKELLKRNPDTVIKFVGRENGMEEQIVRREGFDFAPVRISGLVGLGVKAKAKSLFLIPGSFSSAAKLLREFKPEVVVGTGCYVSGPIIMSASLMKIPTLVTDAHARPGLTNRILSPFVTKAAVWFESAQPHFKGKAVITGNPVRDEFFQNSPRENADDKFHILVYGGSLSSRFINDILIEALPFWSDIKERLFITHETGAASFKDISEKYKTLGWHDNIFVTQRIESMPSAYQKADVVICRSGASTCAELAAAGKASIMIPFPHATDNHQYSIASAFKSNGAAQLFVQSEIDGEILAETIKNLEANPELVEKMQSSAKKLSYPRAASDIADLIEQIRKR
jgi:UDP-N-acetylglucosamine--N-acetylmuramyl-(pentapeptide) pyrophosphoryl-undecaprenol N-acetylglucosamine transferase